MKLSKLPRKRMENGLDVMLLDCGFVMRRRMFFAKPDLKKQPIGYCEVHNYPFLIYGKPITSCQFAKVEISTWRTSGLCVYLVTKKKLPNWPSDGQSDVGTKRDE